MRSYDGDRMMAIKSNTPDESPNRMADPTDDTPKRKPTREERLQAQLRGNLKRRKEQARARRGTEHKDVAPGDRPEER